jgi:hypothetical protein
MIAIGTAEAFAVRNPRISLIVPTWIVERLSFTGIKNCSRKMAIRRGWSRSMTRGEDWPSTINLRDHIIPVGGT